MNRIKIGISSCLLGEKVRYDGGHKHDQYITDTLGRFFDLVPVCPEVECGLSIPREAMHLVGTVDDPRLVTVRTGIDHTPAMKEWTGGKLDELERQQLCGYIFKSRSPSCAVRGVNIYAGSPSPRRSAGIFATAFMKRFPLMPVEDEGRFHDLELRENFIERLFVFERWRELTVKKRGSFKDLLEFHTSHKLLVMAHSPKHLSVLGRLVSHAKRDGQNLADAYIRTLMEGLRLIATTRKNTNVLHHIAGYFKKKLTRDEKKELLEVIDRYHDGLIPLAVPATLLNHYVRKYDEPYLKRQCYLNPHPFELMVKNHV